MYRFGYLWKVESHTNIFKNTKQTTRERKPQQRKQMTHEFELRKIPAEEKVKNLFGNSILKNYIHYKR